MELRALSRFGEELFIRKGARPDDHGGTGTSRTCRRAARICSTGLDGRHLPPPTRPRGRPHEGPDLVGHRVVGFGARQLGNTTTSPFLHTSRVPSADVKVTFPSRTTINSRRSWLSPDLRIPFDAAIDLQLPQYRPVRPGRQRVQTSAGQGPASQCGYTMSFTGLLTHLAAQSSLLRDDIHM